MSAIEDLFCGGRVRILKELSTVEGLTVDELSRRIKLNQQGVRNHLKVLLTAGIVERKRLGRIRLYCFNEDSRRALGLRRFLLAYQRLK